VDYFHSGNVVLGENIRKALTDMKTQGESPAPLESPHEVAKGPPPAEPISRRDPGSDDLGGEMLKTDHILPVPATIIRASKPMASQPPKRKPTFGFPNCTYDWIGERDEATINLVKKLISHFESHLLDAKIARAAGDNENQDRFLQAALLVQFCIFEGCIALLWNQYCYQEEYINQPNMYKLERLCKLASDKSGRRERPDVRHKDIRDGLSHARSSNVPNDMPKAEEIEVGAILMDDFCKRLDSVLR
jgi:hypothetical protein